MLTRVNNPNGVRYLVREFDMLTRVTRFTDLPIKADFFFSF